MSRRSVRSVRAVGTIPIGQLQINDPPPSCLDHGDVVRLLDLPQNCIVGHDDMSMEPRRETIQGIRDVPPGVHLLWVQQVPGISRAGYWYITKAPGVLRVKQWSRSDEVLGDPADESVVLDEKNNIDSILPTLVPYDRRNHDGSSPTSTSTSPPPAAAQAIPEPPFASDPATMWHQLTNAISRSFLNRVTSRTSATDWPVDSTDCMRETRGPNSPQPATGTELDFLFLKDFRDLDVLDHGVSRTREFDTTTRVLVMLNAITPRVRERDIVAELQFTFLTGMHLNNAECIEQWWNLVLKIVLRSYDLPLNRPDMCRWLLQTLHAQLLYTETRLEFSTTATGAGAAPRRPDGPNKNRLLYEFNPENRHLLLVALSVYKRRLNELLLDLGRKITLRQQAVGNALEELEAWLWRCGWDLRGTCNTDEAEKVCDEAEDDDQPVVVALDDNGREIGLVNFNGD
ncbi:AAR2 protein-domain-containing protein [Podospora appendiculata]|uniref:AAR2 protein-domain-containing protein n=1 Tax=Podospora appendiculata TaxID=314037 RepID=A0AAE1CF45_9PEZI|nr:AAR2 protein-domain-containing protein [Podospora appendiculata]